MAILLTKEMNQQLTSLSFGTRSIWDKIRERPRWRWSAVAGVALVGLVGFRVHESRVAAAKAKMKGPMAVPVGAAVARQGDIPVYLDGLGNVIAFYTVTVHSRVDGQLMSVAFREGQTVKEGDMLALIDPRPYQAALDQAEGQLARDQALLADAKLDLERYKDLVAQNAIPKQQLDTQVATVGQYEGAVKNDQGTVEAAKVNLVYTKITSPINGRVGLRLVDPGNIVHAADANGLLVITQLQPIAVVFTLPEDSAPKVMQKFSAGAKLQAKVYNRDKSQLLATGLLLTPDNQMDPTTGTLKLKAVFDNKDNTLFPNQFVNIRLLLDTLHNQVIAPAAAIQRGSQGTFVYVVKPDQTVDARSVAVGVTEGLDASFDSGLSAGWRRHPPTRQHGERRRADAYRPPLQTARFFEVLRLP
jgi:membrane fusion protein, multidrug efflux system